MQIFATFAAIASLLMLCACFGPTVDSQFANRQVAYIDIQAGPKVDVMQVNYLKGPLQQAIISKLKGRGQPPAIGVTVRIFNIDIPGEQGFGETLLGSGSQGAYILAEADLWDPSTRQSLTKFAFGAGVQVRRATALGSVLGYTEGSEPDNADDINFKLVQRLAEELSISLYGYGDK
ncbi:MAG: hypothetical protein K2Q12_04290 [Rickettsiales bacterium]|nr:hypothetical protein [Rickettsiales bacterium]